MIFYFLITVVFIAEIIITVTIIINLLKLDRIFISCNSFIEEVNPTLNELLVAYRKISEQLVSYAPIFVEQIKAFAVKLFVDQLKNMLGALTFCLVKNVTEKHIHSTTLTTKKNMI